MCRIAVSALRLTSAMLSAASAKAFPLGRVNGVFPLIPDGYSSMIVQFLWSDGWPIPRASQRSELV